MEEDRKSDTSSSDEFHQNTHSFLSLQSHDESHPTALLLNFCLFSTLLSSLILMCRESDS